ncbi:hypothetical protein MPL3356_40330 [Mesorhizobium plurifarium]|uniref:DUF1304 domain-containing protein n=1 Tax=Mesorhizobium plurifarium TaxID=69974 RepID=A0A090FWV3_MESPL|nr:hypothetical protein MPL3356_40330 [Mesorhizobium plurifarium]
MINAGNKLLEETMIGNILVGVVALIHCYIVYLEMVLWDTPRGRKAFGLTPEFASASKVLAAIRASITASSPPGCSGVSVSAPADSRSRCSSCSASR